MMTYMSDLPIDAAKKKLRTEEGMIFGNLKELSTSSHLKFSNPNVLMAFLCFFPRGKQCPKHWQADRFKGIVQKL